MLYRINVDNDGDGRPDVIYEFRFKTTVANPNTFLYNTGPIASLDSPNFNRRQTYSVTEVRKNRAPRKLGDNLHVAAVQRRRSGRRRTTRPSRTRRSTALDDGIKVFAGQRLDGFFVDLGSVFDLAALRPFQNLHLIPTPAAAGVNALRAFNVHTIAIQVPITPPHPRRQRRRPTRWRATRRSACGRRRTARRHWCATTAMTLAVGPFVQVSRLGNPLFNEVIVPMGRKDDWNATSPDRDKDFAQYVARPELAKLLPVLYPGVFPNLACATTRTAPTCWRSC